ncbi:MAG: Rpn family recombination-promoting nuclease/putative transposase [Chloroflexota bacterium]
MSVFIDLKTDFAFKIVFGRADSEAQLISFLNAILYDSNPTISTVTILNPYLPGEVESLKDTFVDVQAELDDGSIVIIEMQMSMKPDFFKRMIFNVAKRYSSQLESGEYYSRLVPVIGLVVANFVYPEADQIGRPITKYALLETTDHILYPDSQDFRIAIVELPKFRKQLEQLNDVADMWLYLLTRADKLREVPPNMAKVKEIQTALEAAKRINLSAVELDELDKRRMYAMQEEENLAWARRDALEEGIEIGFNQGIEQGKQQGVKEIVLRMHAQEGLSHAQIARLVALTAAEVEKIIQSRPK